MKQRQSGSAHAVIIIILVAALVFALGLIFWQNFIQQKAGTNDMNQTIVAPKENTKRETQSRPTLSQDVTLNTKSLSTDTAIDSLKDVSESFKTFLKTRLAKFTTSTSESDDCSASVTVERVYEQTYATGSEGACIGRYRALWADTNGDWRLVSSTQNDGFVCKDLTKYKIPSEIAGSQCITSDGSGHRNYNQQ